MVGEKDSLSPWRGFLFPNIFRSFRMAIQPSNLSIAFAAVTAICLTGWIMDLGRAALTTDQNPTTRHGIFAALWDSTETEMQTITAPLLAFDVQGFVSSLVGAVSRGLQILVWLFTHHAVYSIVFFAVVLVALSLAGGAICRLTAVQFAQDRRPGLTEACRFSRKRLLALVAAPIGPLAIAVLLGLPIILLGLVGNIPVVGEILAGLLLPLALVLAPFIAVLLIGEAAGLSLMFPAVAYEDSDTFDAISRSFSNIYAKPWRMGFYLIVAAAYGTVCYLFVRFFAFLLLGLTRGFLQVGLRDEKLQTIWPEISFWNLLGPQAAAPETWSLWLGAFFVRIWSLAVVGLMVSFLVSFYFTSTTIIYALMRNRVDGTPLDEVYETPAETANASFATQEPSRQISPAPEASETSE